MPYGSTVGKNQDCVQDTVRLNQLEAGHACHVVLKKIQQNQSYNELLIIMPENRQYCLFASFCTFF